MCDSFLSSNALITIPDKCVLLTNAPGLLRLFVSLVARLSKFHPFAFEYSGPIVSVHLPLPKSLLLYFVFLGRHILYFTSSTLLFKGFLLIVFNDSLRCTTFVISCIFFSIFSNFQKQTKKKTFFLFLLRERRKQERLIDRLIERVFRSNFLFFFQEYHTILFLTLIDTLSCCVFCVLRD